MSLCTNCLQDFDSHKPSELVACKQVTALKYLGRNLDKLNVTLGYMIEVLMDIEENTRPEDLAG